MTRVDLPPADRHVLPCGNMCLSCMHVDYCMSPVRAHVCVLCCPVQCVCLDYASVCSLKMHRNKGNMKNAMEMWRQCADM